MGKALRMMAVLLLAIAFFGCAQRKVVMAPSDKDMVVDATRVEGMDAEGMRPEMVAKAEDEVDDMVLVKDVSFGDVYFDYDSYDIKAAAKPVLKDLALWLTKTPGSKVVIEGHCDERGTNEYNLALGDRRARAVLLYISALGVSALKAETISFGEERPACKEQEESCWAKNRRAHFVLYKKR